MAIVRTRRRIAAPRLEAAAHELLGASTLCAIATVSARGQAYVNTAYFAWTRELNLVWLSHSAATHSMNLQKRATTAIAIYDSSQTWGRPDRGIQLFGTARTAAGRTARAAERIYGGRFPDYAGVDLSAYGFYLFRPRRLKLFDERAFGSGVFVSARADRGEISWESTDVYDGGS